MIYDLLLICLTLHVINFNCTVATHWNIVHGYCECSSCYQTLCYPTKSWCTISSWDLKSTVRYLLSGILLHQVTCERVATVLLPKCQIMSLLLFQVCGFKTLTLPKLINTQKKWPPQNVISLIENFNGNI